MTEDMRKIAEMPACPRIIFLREQADIVAQVEQPLEQRAGLFLPAKQDKGVGKPKAAGAFRCAPALVLGSIHRATHSAHVSRLRTPCHVGGFFPD